MIDARKINARPVWGISDGLMSQLKAGLPATKQKQVAPVLKMFAAFLDVTGQSISSDLSVGDKTIAEYFGFLLIETQYGLGAIKNHIKALFAIFGGSGTVGLFTEEGRNNSKCLYLNADRNAEKLKYYDGWWFESRGGKEIEVKLANFSKRFGPEITKRYYLSCYGYISKFKDGTSSVYSRLFERYAELLVKHFNGPVSLKLLEIPGELNNFFRYVFDEEIVLVPVGQRKTFTAQWAIMANVVSNSLVMDDIYPELPYPLYAPIYNDLPYAVRGCSKSGEDTRVVGHQLGRLVTSLPLKLTSSEEMDAFREQLQHDIDAVRQCSLLAGASIVSHFHKKLGALAKIHNLPCVDSTDIPGMLKLVRDISHEVGASEIMKVFGRLGNNHIMPFLYQMVIEHPQITPAWLLDISIYDENGNPIQTLDNGHVLHSIKARRGSKAWQEIVLTLESRQAFQTLVLITEPARLVLAHMNNPDFKKLLLKNITSKESIQAVTRLTAVGDATNRKSMFSRTLKKYFNGREKVWEGITLKRVRTSCGVLVYFKTKNVREMAYALGHYKYNARLINRYLPKWIREFFLSRDVRKTQEATIYHAMKESPLLLEAVSLGDKREVSDFMLKHFYSLEPFEQRDRVAYGQEQKTEKSNDLNLVINPFTAQFFLSFSKALTYRSGNALSMRLAPVQEISDFVVAAKYCSEDGIEVGLPHSIQKVLINAHASQAMVTRILEVIDEY